MSKRTPPATAAGATFAARTPLRLRTVAGALALFLAAACVDRTATEPELRPPPDASGPAASLTCRADVRAGTLECAPPTGAGGASAVILGGQGTNVRLRSTGMSYDGVGTFRMDVTVENLTGQVLGTADGTTPAPEGVRVFFASGPASATGAVEVANATGEAFFTAAGQKYFQYNGPLMPADTTPPLEWRFSVPPAVESFQFSVYVAAAVRHEEGWLRLAPFFPTLAVGESMPLTAHPLDVAGRPRTGGAVTWSSADTTIARVASDGTVTGVAAGTTRVSASDGAATSSVQVRVRPSGGDMVAPTAYDVALTPDRVTASGGDSVTVSVRMTDGGSGVRWLQAALWSPSHVHSNFCIAWEPVEGTPADGTFSCRIGIPLQAEGGVWTVASLWLLDMEGNQRTAGPVHLRDAGVDTHVYVHSPTPDMVAPAIESVAFTPDSIEANGLDSTTVEWRLSDAGTGVAGVGAVFRSPSGESAYCGTSTPWAGTPADGTFRCRIGLPFDGESGDWTLESVGATDGTGNLRRLLTPALDSAGYQTVLRVSSPPADTLPPSLTGFSFTPDTVAANGLDSVTVSMELTDAGSGANRAEIHFLSPSNRSVACAAYTPELLHPGPQVITCRLAIPAGRETGEWRVWFVQMRDALENEVYLYTADLQALGYPVTLTVTP
jgi:hypothetical protein